MILKYDNFTSIRSDVFTADEFQNKTIFNFNYGNKILINYGFHVF